MLDAQAFSFLSLKVPKIPKKSVEAVLKLKEDGATVPFIARYRKEQTGNLDEVGVRDVISAFDEWEELVKRKAFLIKEIGEQGNLTDDISKAIAIANDMGVLDEIYRPFKKKKKTKATIAREAGLEPLADWLLEVGGGKHPDGPAIEEKAKEFLKIASGIVTFEMALKGAQDIIVERLYNNTDLRNWVREDYNKNGRIISKKGKKFKPNSKYETYAQYEEPVAKLLSPKTSHRYLAMRRGWHEGELTVTIKGSEDEIHAKFFAEVCKDPQCRAADFLKNCSKVAFTNHVDPSIGNEVHRLLKINADKDSTLVFSENVKRLLLASPFGPKCVLGVDPGLRTGCKLALVDKAGQYISHTVMHINGNEVEEKAKTLFADVTKQISIEAIAVGNGTAGRETERFLRKILKDLNLEIPIVLVNESGASVYSASDVAREEFPDLDLTVRGAISIARRLQDPLAELVKIEPKSIGVGQYQHDVNQAHLKSSLGNTVESCVNSVGVDVNTASESLLSYVSGIGPAIAKNIVKYRSEKGLFKDRSQLNEVTSLNSKVYEQCAGFLRVFNGTSPLDGTGIHPEKYSAVRDIAGQIGVSINDLMGDGSKKLLDERTKWAELIGEFTFEDICAELQKPGRDPRDPFQIFQFREDIYEVKDLKVDMVCPGIVTNVTNFGAFVDIGVHQDGLVHISELSQSFVNDTRKVVVPGQQVKVKVIKVDMEKNQISLSLKIGDKKPFVRSGKKKEGDRGTAKGPRKNFPKKSARGAAKGAGKKGSGKKGPRKDGGSRSGPPRPAKTPFNNPFAALAGMGDDKK